MKAHAMMSCEYYNQFLRVSETEGVCDGCGKPTTYDGLRVGYRRYCSRHCRSTSEEFSKSISASTLKSWTTSRKQQASARMQNNTFSKGSKRSQAFKQHLSSFWKGHPGYWTGKVRGSYPKEWCANISEGLRNSVALRESMIRRTEKQCALYGLPFPFRGNNEVLFFAELQRSCPYMIILQAKKCGYFLDGFISELNVAIEFDELYHANAKQTDKDLVRQHNIERSIKCTFIRVLESSWLKDGDNVVKVVVKEILNNRTILLEA